MFLLTISVPIKLKAVVQMDTSLLDNSVLSAMILNIGIQSVKNVSLVMLDMSGTVLFTYVIAAQLQEA